MEQRLRQWKEIKKYHVLIDTAWVLRALICEDTQEAVILGYGAFNTQFPADKASSYILDYNVSQGWHGMLDQDKDRIVHTLCLVQGDTESHYKVLNQRHVFYYKDF